MSDHHNAPAASRLYSRRSSTKKRPAHGANVLCRYGVRIARRALGAGPRRIAFTGVPTTVLSRSKTTVWFELTSKYVSGAAGMSWNARLPE